MKQVLHIAGILLLTIQTMAQQSSKEYQAELDAWHQQRIARLKMPNGWLNLVGLHWLSPGINRFGSSKKNDIVFPAGTIAPEAGYFEVNGNKVALHPAAGVRMLFEGKPFTTLIQFDQDSGKDRQVQCGSLRWTIIKRQEKLGIRLRDDKSKTIAAFKGIERFPANSQFRVAAKFEAADTAHRISISNKIGQQLQEKSPGRLLFSFGGKEYTLDALDEGEDILIVFADLTTGKQTYGAGRFITLKKPAPGDNLVLDFNKAYNPPCVFTPFATCPLPPPQNRLPFAVSAGEKNYGHAD